MKAHITVVFTRHIECGKCNSEELSNIIQEISPDIIFEELSNSNFDKCYNTNSLITLESNAIKSYLHINYIEHIPVDTFELLESYYNKIDYMYNKIFNLSINEGFKIRELLKNQAKLDCQLGFIFLNSSQNDELFEEFNNLKVQILKIINDEKLFQIFRMEKEAIEKREDEIINNIYNYSNEHKFNRAILFVGSGHRKSIMSKIDELNKQVVTTFNWDFYGSKDLPLYPHSS